MRVLLVAGVEMTQKLSGLLAQAPLEVEHVDTGLRALERFESLSFSLLLVDVHLAEMDGVRVTRLLRAREKVVAGRIPILGLSATPSATERQRCLAAGMDDYLAADAAAAELLPAIGRLLPGKGEGSPQPASDPDWLRGLRNMDIPAEPLRELLQAFVSTVPDTLVNLRQAVTVGDAVEIQRKSHSLKNSLGVFTAPEAMAAAGRLEALASRRELDEMAGLFAELQERTGALLASMEEFLRRFRQS